MTAHQLQKLKELTHVGSTTIYKVARKLGRVPFAWEVIYYTKPRGRHSQYVSKSPEPLIYLQAKDLWTKMSVVADIVAKPESDWDDYFEIITETFREYLNHTYMVCIAPEKVMQSLLQFIEDYGHSKLIPHDKLEKATAISDGVMTYIISILKEIIFGG